MRHTQFDLKEFADLALAVTDFQKLAMYFSQMGNGIVDLNKYWEEKIVRRTQKTWMTEHEYDEWCRVSVHIVHQVWGSTAGGWGGIGGAAMTSAITTVIENETYGIAAIYWGGRRAYIVEIDDKYRELAKTGYHMPGMSSVMTRLKVLQKSK